MTGSRARAVGSGDLMAAFAASQPAVPLEGYVSDGRRDLFRVVDVLPGEAVLLENALGGELSWHAVEELGSAPLERIVPAEARERFG